jgi:hypothetical protein
MFVQAKNEGAALIRAKKDTEKKSDNTNSFS